MVSVSKQQPLKCFDPDHTRPHFSYAHVTLNGEIY